MKIRLALALFVVLASGTSMYYNHLTAVKSTPQAMCCGGDPKSPMPIPIPIPGPGK
jgi:hypothetical protein